MTTDIGLPLEATHRTEPVYSVCFVGRGRYFWAVWASLGAATDAHPPTATGYTSGKQLAIAAALGAGGKVKTAAYRARWYHEQLIGKRETSTPRLAVYDRGSFDVPELAPLGLVWPYTVDELRRAYRRYAREHHPDAGGDAEAFRTLTEAYEWALTAIGANRT